MFYPDFLLEMCVGSDYIEEPYLNKYLNYVSPLKGNN